ncbi:MAG: hypothetical protein KAY32_06425 [Candidatus Eisenbacteria sp.]|nr:hypothetical protein [Candidatus Eisenbacteria bacterium]
MRRAHGLAGGCARGADRQGAEPLGLAGSGDRGSRAAALGLAGSGDRGSRAAALGKAVRPATDNH